MARSRPVPNGGVGGEPLGASLKIEEALPLMSARGGIGWHQE